MRKNAQIALAGFFVFFSILFNSIVKAQSPGSVSTSLNFWLKANSGVFSDAGVTAATNNTTVAQWNDVSGGAKNMSQTTAANRPTFLSNATNHTNYNPFIHFSGNPVGMARTGTILPTGNNNYDYYSVSLESVGGSATSQVIFSQGQVGTQFSVLQLNYYATGGLQNSWNSSAVSSSSNVIKAGVPNVVELNYDKTTSTREILIDGAKVTTSVTSTHTFNLTSDATVGYRDISGTPSLFFEGDLAELVIYSKLNTAAEKSRIQSYLAIKYGLTLSKTGGGAAGNYVASNGTTTVWTASTNSVYHNGVVGIARDDNSGLLQKQSHQIDDSTRVYISSLASTNAANTGSFSANNQFVMMGHNGGALANGSTEFATDISSRLTREWRVTNTAFTGTFSMDIKLASPCGTFTNDLKLLIDADGNFSSGATTATGVTFSYSSGVITIGGITTTHIPQNSTRFITLATGTVTTGTITANQIIVTGKSPANLTLSGNGNPITFWESSTDNFVSNSSTLASSASSTLTSAHMGSLTVNTHYRAAAVGLLCAKATSSVALVRVMPSAPGGVANTIYLWAKADAGVVTSGTTANVSRWNNQAPTLMTAEASISSATPSITLDNTKFNYEPCVHFTGTSGKYLEGTFASSVKVTNPGVFFLVSQSATNSDCCRNPISFDPVSQSIAYNNGTVNGYAIDGSGAHCSITTDKTGIRGVVRADFAIGGSNTSGAVLSFNSVSNTVCGAIGLASSASGLFQIGGRPFGNLPSRVFPGDIAEVIYYHDNNTLTTTEMQKIESYLALKYGISLAANYLNTEGSTIYSVNSYSNNIIGIIRDDASGLNHKQSHTLDDTVRVYMGALATTNTGNTSSFSSNLSSVMLGSDNGKMCSRSSTVTEKPAGIYSLLDREWKVTNTNFSSTFSMDFKLNSCGNLSNVNVDNLRLLVDNDGDFTNATAFTAGGGLSISYSNSVITVSGISTSHIATNTSKFITVGSTNQSTPLPIELLFFKAECVASSVKLSWKTASELNNAYFTIERSEDGIQWQTLSKIMGSGTSKIPKMYEYYATGNAQKNDNYYRLKQTDLNGTFTYFDNIGFTNNCTQAKSDVSVYPDPFDNNISIRGKNLQSYVILNALGQPVLSGQLNTAKSDSEVTNSIATDNLKEGVYFIQLFESNANNKHCFKIVK